MGCREEGRLAEEREGGLEDSTGDVLWFEMRVAPTDVMMLNPCLVEIWEGLGGATLLE